jgi:hypothetical protein
MFRALAKRLPHPLLMRIHHRYQLAQQSALARKLSIRTGFPLLETLDLRPLKTSDTVFVLGSGSSINEISEARWKVIGCHDTIAMNFWPVHPFVPRIYLFENIVRIEDNESIFDALQGLFERRALDYRNTLKIVSELVPLNSRQLILEIPKAFHHLLYVGYSTNVVARDERELVRGIRYMLGKGVFGQGNQIRWHFKYAGSVLAAMSLAVRMGYRRIVLCGIDLGTAEYFYQHPERYPEACQWEFAPRTQLHPAARRLKWLVPAPKVIAHFKREVLDPAQIELFVENRSSKLFPNVSEVSPTLFERLATTDANLNSERT